MTETSSEDSVEVEAWSLEEAIHRGAAALGRQPDDLHAEVLAQRREGPLSRLGLGRTLLQVRLSLAAPRPKPGQYALAYSGGALRVVVTPPVNGGAKVDGARIRAMTDAFGADSDHHDWLDKETGAATGRPFALPEDAFERKDAPAPAVHGTACVIVQPDRLAAWLLATSFDPQRTIQASDVEMALDTAGVSTGRLAEAIQRMHGHTLPHPAVVARGRPAQHGHDAAIEILLGRGASDADDPEVPQPGARDFRAIEQATYVTAGTQLARKEPATPGRAGETVLGEELAATDGADADLTKLVGKNTEMKPSDEQPDRALVATVSGNASVQGQKINMEPNLVISGNVDFHTGNIDFPGPVTVSGDVESGFSLKAGGNVAIGGVVDGGTVIATGDVIVRGGFLAEAEGQHGHIKAGGNVRVELVLGGLIQAKGDVVVAKEVMRATIEARGSIVVENGGQVHGAQLIAGGNVSAGVFGGRLGARTNVAAGSRMDSAEFQKLLREDLQDGALGDAVEAGTDRQSDAAPSAPATASPTDGESATGATGAEPAAASPAVEVATEPEEDDDSAGHGDRSRNDATATDSPESAETRASTTGDTPPDDDHTPDPATLAGRPRITVGDHVEPGVLLAVSGAHLRVDTPLHHFELVEDQGALITLPLR